MHKILPAVLYKLMALITVKYTESNFSGLKCVKFNIDLYISIGNDEQFALVLFVEEEKYSVIHKGRIQEDHYAYDQVVHVLWGKGKTAQHYPARLISCGNCLKHLI